MTFESRTTRDARHALRMIDEIVNDHASATRMAFALIIANGVHDDDASRVAFERVRDARDALRIARRAAYDVIV